MSEIALLSNQSSSLYASSVAGSSADQSEYVYDMDRSSVNKFKSRMTRVKVNNPTFGGQVSVEIPSFGILTKMVLRTRITFATQGTHGAQAGADLAKSIHAMIIDRVSLMNSSREIQTLYGDCIQYLVYNMPKDEKEKWLAVGADDPADGSMVQTTGVTVPFTNAAQNPSVDIYTLLPFSCFHEGGSGTPYKSCFNTRFIEKLNCTIKFADVGGAGGLASAEGTNGFTGSTIDVNHCELLCDFDVLEQKSLNKVEESNYSLSQPLAQVMSNWALTKRSSGALAGGNTKMNLNLFNTQLAHSIVIVVDRKDNAGLDHGANYWQKYGTGRHVALKGIKLSSAGRVLYEATTAQECAFIGSTDNSLGNCWGKRNVGAPGSDKIYVIPFGNLLRDTSATKGCVALKNLNSLELEVDIVGAADTHEYELKSYCRFYQATATQSNTGRISISLSS